MTVDELKNCIERDGTSLYSFCYYLTGNRPDADDLYQDTFLTALSHLSRIDTAQNPKGYLLSVSVRLWKNQCRKLRRRQELAPVVSLEDQTEAAQIPDMGQLPEEAALDTERSTLLWTLVQQLDDRYRIPLLLTYASGMQQDEIASCLHIPKGTVKSRLFKARNLLRDRLEAAEYDRL